MWLSTSSSTTTTTTTSLPLCVMTDCHVHSSMRYHNKHTVQHALDFFIDVAVIVVVVVVVVIVYFAIVNDIYMHDVKWNTDEAAVNWCSWSGNKEEEWINKMKKQVSFYSSFWYWQWSIHLRWRSKTINDSIRGIERCS